MALGFNDSVYAWGSNRYKQLGPHVPVEVQSPMRLTESHGLVVRDIACGDSHMLIMTTADTGDATMFNFDDEPLEGPFIECPPERRTYTEGSTRIVTPGQLDRQPSWAPVIPGSESGKVALTEPDFGFDH